MPKREPEELAEQPVAEQSVRAEMPLIRARVVYLGAARNKSVAIPGSIMIEHFEDAAGLIERKDRETGEMRKYVQTRKVVDGGITSYDFSSHDIRGNLVRERLMPDTAPERLRGKVYCWVEHPLHIAEFYLGAKDRDGERQREFEVLARPEDQDVVKEYVRRLKRREQRQQADVEEVLRG